MKRLPWFEILLTFVIMSMSLYAALSDPQNFSLRWFTRDDAYYYFKVAQNISEGKGSTFDGINPTNGYHPLWVLVCIPLFALARFDLVLPLRILLLVMSGLSVATAILLYRLIGKVLAPAIGAVAALYWAFSYDLLTRLYQMGLETGIAAFFIALLACKLLEFERSWRDHPVTKKQFATLGLVAALVMFSRLDLVFLAGIAGLWIVFREHPMRYFLPLDILSTFVSVLLAFLIRLPLKEYFKYSEAAVTMIALSLVINITAAYWLGLYRSEVIHHPRQLLWRLAVFAVGTSALAGAVMIAIRDMAHFEGFPRLVIAFNTVVSFLLFGITRFMFLGLRTDRSTPRTDDEPIPYVRAHWRQWLNDGMAYFGIVFGALGIYMVWNRIAFGAFSPVSGQIKRWWGSLDGLVYGGRVQNELAFFGIDYTEDANVWHPVSTLLGGWAERMHKLGIVDTWRYLILLAVFALFFYLILMINKQKAKNALAEMSIIPLLCGACLQVFSYHITGYAAFKEWYWIIQPLLVVITLSLMAGMLLHPILKFRAVHLGLWILAIGLGIQMGLPFWGNIQRIMPYHRWALDHPNDEIADFLEEHTEPGSIVGLTGGGTTAYFISNRIIVNMDGLINSNAYFQSLKNRTAGAYLAGIGMDYVLVNEEFIDQLPYDRQFKPYLEKSGMNYYNMSLFRYRSYQP
jgi:hypothetical protein